MSVEPAGRELAPRLLAFRIVKRKFLKSAFSGIGARQWGGRWNSVGTPMVYCAGSLSLAILEWRVHLAQWPSPALVVIRLEFPRSVVWKAAKLPARWNAYPAPRSTARFGDAWVKSQRSAILCVPSAVVPQEYNFLFNPLHPDFQKVIIGKPQLFRPDVRLAQFNP